MSAIIVVLKCLTNMHVGNGEVNYNIIDNEVERDPVTGYPTINSSGVKGALREFLTSSLKENEIAEIFGGRVSKETTGNATQQGNVPQQGKLKFLPANMLAMPFRASSGSEPYYHVVPEQALKQFNEYAGIFLKGSPGLEKKPKTTTQAKTQNQPAIEGYSLSECETVDLKALLGDHITAYTAYIVQDDIFRTLSLPVVARNCLDNGQSSNLWYEELVPHKSVFYFPVVTEDNEDCNDLLTQLHVNLHGKIVQFGGNASIGCGLCKLTILSAEKQAQR